MNLKKERQFLEKGFWLVGVDEAGRGPLAGPVFAGAVLFKKPQIIPEALKQIRDSKELSEKKREELFKILVSRREILWGVGRVGPKVIDKINILEATRLAMKRAVKNLLKKNSGWLGKQEVFLLIDGQTGLGLEIKEETLVAADKKIFSCAAASIVAKVLRDKAMRRYHSLFPVYDFDRHKGYGTRGHFRELEKHGPCKIHRKSFRPISDAKAWMINAK